MLSTFEIVHLVITVMPNQRILLHSSISWESWSTCPHLCCTWAKWLSWLDGEDSQENTENVYGITKLRPGYSLQESPVDVLCLWSELILLAYNWGCAAWWKLTKYVALKKGDMKMDSVSWLKEYKQVTADDSEINAINKGLLTTW